MQRHVYAQIAVSIILSFHVRELRAAEVPLQALSRASMSPSRELKASSAAGGSSLDGGQVYRALTSSAEKAIWEKVSDGDSPAVSFQIVYTAWMMDSAYAQAQSIDYAMEVDDPDYLKQTLFVAGLLKKAGQKTDGRISDGVLAVGDYEFQLEGDALIRWRKNGLWTSFESFPVPISIPPEMLDPFRTQV